MKNKFSLFVVVIFFSFCFVIFYKGLNAPNNYTPKVNEKKNIPTFKAKDFYWNNYVNSDKIFEENIFYVVNIWASWCVPCRTEHPLLMQLSKNQSIKLIGLNYRDNFNNAKKFIDDFGNPYSRILIDKDGTLGVEFGAYGVPETFLIDKNKDIIKKNSSNYTQCDSLLMGNKCGAHTVPYIKNKNSESNITHEATTSKISEEQLHYCQQRGLSQEEAVGLIVNGFCKEVLQQLPMEFAVEAQKLVGISLEGSVG